MHYAQDLTEANFSSVKNFHSNTDSVENYRKFVRMTFRETGTAQEGQSAQSVKQATDVRVKDFYFAASNEEWLE